MTAATRAVRVACGYRAGALPAEWAQLARRLRSQLVRARLDARVMLLPLGPVAAGADVLVVPAALAADARRLADAERVVAIAPGAFEPGIAEIVRRLGREAPAKRGTTAPPTRTVVRRGSTVVPWSAD